MSDEEALIIPNFPMIPQLALAWKGQAEVVVVVIVDSCREVCVR